MRTELCEKLDIEVPIFAFTHCRDVAAEVSKAGGLGCLGCAFMTPEELKEHLDWMDEQVGDKPYGVDFLMPHKYEGKGEGLSADELDEKLWGMVPDSSKEFVAKLLKDYGVPEWPESGRPRLEGLVIETAMLLFDEAMRHPKCKVIVNAMGTPPPEVVKQCHDTGRLVGALTGRKKHALQHKAAGLDFIIANGAEGGGHTGAIGSVVLWPELVDAVAPMPVLAAGGIGNGRQVLAALGMGAQGVWTGSLWLTVEEAAAQPKQRQRYLDATTEDTIISRSWSGKTARYLNNEWTKAWADANAPKPADFSIQMLLTADARRRTERYGEVGNVQDVAFNPAGQVIGQINEVETCRGVIFRLMSEYVDALEKVNRLTLAG